MAQWEADKEHIMRRLDRFDERFDKIERDNKEERNKMYAYFDENNKVTRDRIDELKLEVLKIASSMGNIHGEFKYKTGVWGFLGIVITIAIGLLIYLIKTQLI